MAVSCWAPSRHGKAAEFHIPPHTFTLPDGFEIEKVAGPPGVLRPMMADFDEQGRLYVADSSGSNEKVEKQLEEKPHRIVRLEDVDGDGRYESSVVFADELMFPEGVLWHGDAVYTGAPPSIWKLADTDGDGVADRRSEWHQGMTLTGCANDLHGPYEGPDGWIYWCKGGFAKQTYERPGRRTISDSAAHIFRAMPDYSEFESVIGGGMDNPVEVTFSPEGEVFFITTFFHHPEAGKRDAIVHGIYGGAYPKVQGLLNELQRTGELLPPMVELGPSAGCSLTRYESRVFGAEYANNLFSAEFNLRRVRRHVLAPVGSTYQSVDEDFLVSDNPDFHPTDVFEDADGSLLVIDTGGWYKICCPTSQLPKPDVLGGIYRIRRSGGFKVEDPRGLEMEWGSASAAELATRLGDARPAVRKRAIKELAAQGPKAIPQLSAVLRNSPTVLHRLNAVWALTRIDDGRARAAVRVALSDSDAGVQQAALHSVGMRRDAMAMEWLFKFLKGDNPFHQRKAAEALGRIGASVAVPRILQAAATVGAGFRDEPEAVRIQEHALIYALIEIGHSKSTRSGLTDGAAGVRRAALIALDQMDGGALNVQEVTPMLSDPDLRGTAMWVALNHPEWGSDLAGYFRERLEGELTAADALELQQQISRFAGAPAIQQLVGQELLKAEGTDRRRVLMRAMTDAGLKGVPAGWGAALRRQLLEAESDVLVLAVRACGALPWSSGEATEMNAALRQLAKRGSLPAALRVEAMAAAAGEIGELDMAMFELLLGRLKDEVAPLERMMAASVLVKAELTTAQQLRLAEELRVMGPMELNRLLEAFAGSTEDAVGLAIVESIKASRVRTSVRVDLLSQRLAQYSEFVQAAGRTLLEVLEVDPVEQNLRLNELLAELTELPSDIRRGQLVFNGPRTACATCHTIGYLGGKVGPDLTSIGQIRTERDLLEAVIYPSASFVRNYEPVQVVTRAGDEYGGVIAHETADELMLITGADTRVRLAKTDIHEVMPGTLSLMPSGLEEQLSKQELADLLIFLRNTRWGAK